MTKRRTWTSLRKAAVFTDHNGICHICGAKIATGEPWELEHVIPLAMGGSDDETNARPAHASCHRSKTATDKAQIAKANRVRAKHMGAKSDQRKPIPGSKASRWKRKLDGTVVPR